VCRWGLPLAWHMWLSGRGSRSSICSSSIDPLGSRCMTDSSARSLSPSTRWSPPGPGNIWWGHRAVVAVIVMLAVGGPIGGRQLGRPQLFTSLLTAPQAISNEPRVAVRRRRWPPVINIEDGRRSSRQVLFVGVVLLPGATDPAAMANKVVRIVLDTAPEAARMDEITVLLSKGYDIGIARLTETRELSLSPLKWRERVGSSSGKGTASRTVRARDRLVVVGFEWCVVPTREDPTDAIVDRPQCRRHGGGDRRRAQHAPRRRGGLACARQPLRLPHRRALGSPTRWTGG